MTSTKRSRARKVLGVIGGVVGATATFVAATTAAVAVHLDMPAARRLVVAQVNDVLAKQLKGEVRIERLSGLGLGGIEGATVRVIDPDGIQVVYADDIDVRVRTLELARSALFGEGDIRLSIPRASIAHADVALDHGPNGAMRLARAFEPKETKPEEPAKEGGRGLRIEAPDVVLRHAWAHGVPSEGAPAIDAEVMDLAGHALVDSKETRAGLDRVELVTRGLPQGVDPRGKITAKFRLPAGEAAKPDIGATFDGTVMGARTAIVASMHGDRVGATIDIHTPSATRIGGALGELPLRDELTAHVEAHGTLPDVEGNAKIALGGATLDVDANAHLGEVVAIDAKVSTRQVDLSRILEGGPRSDLGLDAEGRISLGEEIRGTLTIDTLPGLIEGQRVPRVFVQSSFTKDTAEATARIDEPSMPTTVRVSMAPRAGDRIVEAHAQTDIPDLRQVPMLGKAIDRGSAQVRAEATLALEAGTFDANVAVAARGVASGAQSVSHVRAEARAGGTLAAPVIDAAVFAEGVHAGGIDMRTVQARTRVEAGEAVVLRGPRVDIDRGDDRLSVSAASVRAAGSKIRVERAQIEGVGDPIRAELSIAPHTTTLKIAAPRIDLVKATRIAGQDLGVKDGTLALGADVTLNDNDARGHVRAKLDRFTMKSVSNASADLVANVDRRDVEIHLDAQLAEAGTIALHSRRITLGGSPVDPASWTAAHGRVALEAAIDMAKISSFAPEDSLPLSELRGDLVMSGALGRDSAASPPEVRLHVHTIGLVAAGTAPPERDIDGTEVKGVAPWRTADFDLGVDVRNDTTSGLTTASVRVHDRDGSVAAFDAKSMIPYAALIADPKGAKAKLVRAPIAGKLVVPRRSVQALPDVLGLQGMRGVVEAELDVKGTAIDPLVVLVAHTRGLRSAVSPAQTAIDGDLALRYDGSSADLGVTVVGDEGAALAVNAHADARAAEFIEPAAGRTPAWSASSRVKLARFPLGSVGALSDMRISGRVSGEATLTGLNEDATLAAHLGLDDLKIGQAAYRSGRIDVDAGGGRLAAKARLDQDDGFAELTASTGIAWGSSIAPALAERKPIDARLVANGFRAAAIQPFVGSAVHGLDGRIDADAKVSITPATKDARLEGTVRLREGTAQLAAIGEAFRSIRATVTMDPSGTIKVDDVYARGVQGELKADAELKLAGTSLRKAHANVRIPEKRPLDLAIDGEPIGEVWAEAKIDAEAIDDGDRMKVVIDLPRVGIELSQSMKSGVQKLEEKERIRVGVYRDGRTFARLPLDRQDFKQKEETEKKQAAASDASVLELDVRLGRVDVDRGNMLRAVISGNPRITIRGEETRINGQVQVDSGWVDVQGKKFEIQRGTVTFSGEPEPDPIIAATAAWTAEDGTQIFADFVGPVETGKVTLRSEPPRPKNEILAMILFGTADGANPTPPPAGRQTDGTTKTAVGLGGGYAAQGLTEALDDLAGIEATARIDTTSTRNPRPEVEVQVSQKVSVAVSHIIGQPPVTEPPDKNLLTVDWHFRPNWSFETTFGDRGRQLFDLIWQKRY